MAGPPALSVPRSPVTSIRSISPSSPVLSALTVMDDGVSVAMSFARNTPSPRLAQTWTNAVPAASIICTSPPTVVSAPPTVPNESGLNTSTPPAAVARTRPSEPLFADTDTPWPNTLPLRTPIVVPSSTRTDPRSAMTVAPSKTLVAANTPPLVMAPISPASARNRPSPDNARV